MKNVGALIMEIEEKIKVVNEQMLILNEEEDGTFGEASEKIEDAICDMCNLREEFYPHEDRIKKEAESGE